MVAPAPAQVILHPNQTVGTVELTYQDPEALGILPRRPFLLPGVKWQSIEPSSVPWWSPGLDEEPSPGGGRPRPAAPRLTRGGRPGLLSRAGAGLPIER